MLEIEMKFPVADFGTVAIVTQADDITTSYAA